MPEQLDDFNFSRKKQIKPGKYNSILDGKIWKIRPSEFDFDDDADGANDCIKEIKISAKLETGRYIQYRFTGVGNITFIVLQLREHGWKPPQAVKRKDKKTTYQKENGE